MGTVDPEQVFAALERQRRSGQLSKAVSQAAVRYQASQAHPGCLDAISADGTRCVGRFQDGTVVPLDAARDEPSASMDLVVILLIRSIAWLASRRSSSQSLGGWPLASIDWKAR